MSTKLTKQDLVFDKDLYEKCLKSFQIAEDYLGLKMHIHADEKLLEDGQIFLFNHFARFETVIPVYIFYRRFGAFTRTIADHQLFDSNERLRKFLCGAGAVPNNLPGLLPFLAAELLKGRKVVIFPEGAMMKSRQVMNEENQFMIFSPRHKSYRKHHSGAAVLALTLDLFKRRIKTLFDNGDTVRLDHWRDALEFESHDELRASVEKPTEIIPTNITFSPLRIGGNFLSNALKLLNRDISETLLEEAIIEGNILLKHTNMDIRFGKPIKTLQNWSWWENWLIDNYFVSIDSLEEFFSLRENAQTWPTRLLSAVLYQKTLHLRDEYISGLYRGITINTGHIGASLVYTYFNAGRRQIDRSEFHHAFYFAIKELQQVPDIHLRSNLSKPDNYRFLYQGNSPTFREWLDIAISAKLIEEQNNNYLLLDKLGEEYGFNEVRLENPLYVSLNEVAAVTEVVPALEKAVSMAANYDPMYFSTQLWDDELRSFAWDAEKFNRPEYADINQHETAMEDHEPYLLTHKDNTRTGVLLIHGFLSSPAELADYGNHLFERGFNVLGVRLEGHGTSPCDLATRSWEDWLDSVHRGFEILAAISDGIIMVGFSTGATLGLKMAAGKPEGLKGLACVCAALKVKDKKLKFAPLAHQISQISGRFLKNKLALGYRRSHTSQPETNYQSMPISALVELRELMAKTQKKLRKINAPLLVMQSRHDDVVEEDSAKMIMDKCSSAHKEMIWIDANHHHILRKNEMNTWNLLDDFIDRKK